MDLLKTERILVGDILAELYGNAPTEVRRALKLRRAINQLAPPFAECGAPKKRIVEIGCGYGFTANYLALLHPHTQVVGIDPDPARVTVARESIGNRQNIVFYTADECGNLDLNCDVMILNQLLWRPDFARSQRTLLENTPQWLAADGELFVRALDPDTHWLRVMAANLRETMLAGEALTTLSREDLTEFCKALGFAKNEFTLEGTYYRADGGKRTTRREAMIKRKPHASLPHKRHTVGLRAEHDEALNFIFSRQWDDLKV